MKNFIKQDGFLSEDGKNFISSFTSEVDKMLNSSGIKSMTPNQLGIFGSLLQKTVADAVLNTIVKK